MESIRRKIDEAEDLADVIDLMKNLNIPTKGFKTIEQMKGRIFEHLNSREENNRVASNEVSKKKMGGCFWNVKWGSDYVVTFALSVFKYSS